MRSLEERNLMVAKVYGLAVREATDFCKRRHCFGDADDAIQVALMGAMRAAEKFEESRNLQYTTYAVSYMRGHLLRWYRARGVIRIPDYAWNHRKPGETAGLPNAIGLGSERKELAMRFQPARNKNPGDGLDAQIVLAKIERLPFRLQVVLRGRFFADMTLSEVGEQLGVTRERVRQLESEAIQAMRKMIKGGTKLPAGNGGISSEPGREGQAAAVCCAASRTGS